jgi:hypothetical protein
MRKLEEAQTAFNDVLTMNPTPELAQGAEKYLSLIKQGKAPRKNWAFTGTVLYQYDTNVVAASETADFPMTIRDDEISGQEDSRAVITLSGYWQYTQLTPWTMKVSYAFYQSWHNKINIFNLQNHLPALTISRKQVLFGHNTTAAIEYRFGEALLSNELRWYSVNHWVTPSFKVMWLENLGTSVGYIYNIEDFHDSEPNRDNFAHTAFGRVDWAFWPKRMSVSVTGGYDWEDGEDDKYDIRRPWVRLNYVALLPLKFKTHLKFVYDFEDHYNDEDQNRQDNSYVVEFFVSRPILWHLEGTAGVSYKSNQSNVKSLSYDRTIVSAGIMVKF